MRRTARIVIAIASLLATLATSVVTPGVAAAAGEFSASGYYPVSGPPSGGGFCITPGGTAPSGTYVPIGSPTTGNAAASATVMWFASLYGPDGTAFTNGAGNEITFGGPFYGVAAAGGTGYGGTALSPLADTVTGEQIANDNVLGIADTDHSDSDTAYVNALTNFANDYPGPW